METAHQIYKLLSDHGYESHVNETGLSALPVRITEIVNYKRTI